MVPVSPLKIVQLTDTHLFRERNQNLIGLPTADSLENVVKQVMQLPSLPDFMLLTGDLSQDGSLVSYEQVYDSLHGLNIPIYWLPGNHDCLENMVPILTQAPFLGDKQFKQGNWHFILLNSQIPGEVPGYLSQETLDWLDRQLSQQAETPALLSLHHPPFSLDTAWLDNSALQNPDDLFAVIDRHPQVKLVLFGHIHQEFQLERKGVTYLAAPSTCIQFARGSATFALDDCSPGFRSVDLYPDGSWHSRIHRVNYDRQVDMTCYEGY
ncbi:3',5'-cyclic-AMP phosphodiesterase [Alkalinema sp. FACHB-956]|uniref:3',5'-cyclic-AMP phosphodiesterase n=1 Tax=Alkalinema sp. FACHB-956 TaxID=2692768 RepID=UPI00168964A1|nr:3',5'-cyclic-AMP phosphodiesterase [Alkalinema sp. FACHB-956]MBD2326190.1 3',5'-cyclic-AMP phosphodiesterase [Alkalinema sp. FACHB-956]